jgi:hypothetical protein
LWKQAARPHWKYISWGRNQPTWYPKIYPCRITLITYHRNMIFLPVSIFFTIYNIVSSPLIHSIVSLWSSQIVLILTRFFLAFVHSSFYSTHFCSIRNANIFSVMFSPQIEWSCSQCRSILSDRRKYCTNCHSMLSWACTGSGRSVLYTHYYRHRDSCNYCAPKREEEKQRKIEEKETACNNISSFRWQ